jgi:hypothetical protein
MQLGKLSLAILCCGGLLPAQKMVGLFGYEGSDLNRQALFSKLGTRGKPGAPRHMTVFPGDRVLPQFVDGGFWSTEVTLINLDTKTIHVSVYFCADDGSDLAVLLAGEARKWRGMDITLDPQNSAALETAGTDTALSQGWVFIETDDIEDALAGLGVFRLRVPGKPDFEAVVPITSLFEHHFLLLFDNTNDRSTGMAIANPFTTQSVSAVIRDEDGNVIGERSLRLGALEHMAASLPVYWKETQNRRGSIEFKTSEYGLTALGLRFNPTGPFTSFHTLVDIHWVID